MGVRDAVSSWFAPWGPPNDIEQKAMPTPGGDTQPYGGIGWHQWPFLLPSTHINYQQEAGDVSQNAIVAACLQWVARTFPEAPIRHMRRKGDEEQQIDDSPLIQLLAQPNEYYSGLMLWAATLWSLNIDGNAYWLKMRRQNGRTAELWYEPHSTCRPVWPQDGSVFISGYQVLRRGVWSDVIKRSDIIHFRALGLDPMNPRKGLSPLAAALREIFTDNEAANFSASLLRNMGVPGVVVSPKGPDDTIDDPEGLKQAMMAKFSGDRRGEPLIMQGPTELEVLSWSPEQMNLEKLRNIPEERITALLGVPAVVAGLGSGLDHSTYSNVEQAKASAYENNLIPTQRLLEAQLNADLVPEFGDPKREWVEFDNSEVRALSEDQSEIIKRLAMGYQSGFLKRAEAREKANMGLESGPEDDVYFTDLPKISERLTETATPGQAGVTPFPELNPLPAEPVPANGKA
jgi:HK97 family phage portal protein